MFVPDNETVKAGTDQRQTFAGVEYRARGRYLAPGRRKVVRRKILSLVFVAFRARQVASILLERKNVFRITTKTEARTTIQVDGDLDASGAAELAKACQNAPAPVSLDLRHLRSANDEGVDILRTLIAKGAEVKNASRYITLLLRDEPALEMMKKRGNTLLD